jgi:hypothetical protein
LKFTKTLITFEPFIRLAPNLARSFISTLPRHRRGQKCHFPKSKMAADETGNRLKNVITSQRFIWFAPNLVSGIYSSRERGLRLRNRKFIIQDGRQPPFCILQKP